MCTENHLTFYFDCSKPFTMTEKKKTLKYNPQMTILFQFLSTTRHPVPAVSLKKSVESANKLKSLS